MKAHTFGSEECDVKLFLIHRCKNQTVKVLQKQLINNNYACHVALKCYLQIKQNQAQQSRNELLVA